MIRVVLMVVLVAMPLMLGTRALGGMGEGVSFAGFDQKARGGQAISVVFFGGSLTWGANASDPQRTSYRALMGEYLRTKYPKTPMVFHDAAIGGTGSKLGIFRLERDVLAYKPDLVFLDFTVNDEQTGTDVPTLDAYESLLQELISHRIPVVQALFCFRFNFVPKDELATLTRYRDHLKLAAAYHTAVGDAAVRMQGLLASGKGDAKELWPIDGAHPGDAGYRVFFEAVRDGLNAAIEDGRGCVVPEKPVFANHYRQRTRTILAAGALPKGWAKTNTLRTALWFDGLSSRWMDEVVACDAKNGSAVEPLRVEFAGTMVGLFGEKTVDGLGFKVKIDGKPLLYQPDKRKPGEEAWPNDTKAIGSGRYCNLFSWIELTDQLAPGKHVLELTPVMDGVGQGQLRLESVCGAGE